MYWYSGKQFQNKIVQFLFRIENKMKVSVIIPTWNRGYIIEKTIQSVLNQTVADFEVLVCDDGSTDDTYEKLSSIKDSRIRWISGRRGGRPAIPRNNGIKEANGEWLAFLDSDDEWMPEKLEKQFELIEKEKVKASSSNALRLIPGKGIVGKYLSLEKEIINFEDLLKVNEVITSSVIIHRSLIKSVFGFPEEEELKTIEDYAFWLRISSQTDFAYSNDQLVIYRDDAENSVRGVVSMSVWKQRYEVFSDFISWTKKIKDLQSFMIKADTERKKAIFELRKTRIYNVIEKIKILLTNKAPKIYATYVRIIARIKKI